MPDWSSPEELQVDADVFVKLIHAVTGVYAWELFLSIDFDWDFLTRKKPFRWPIIFYFANRYLLLFALIGILISFDTTTKLNCQALFMFNQLAGNAAVGLASINLSLRTMAVYGHSKWLTIFLVIVILGHWSLILQAGVLLKAAWSDEAGQCVIIFTNNTILAATFIYSMVFDLLVFILNAYKLLSRKGKVSAMGESRLGRMLFGDGLLYFFIAFISNVLATVFMLLNLNSIMTVIFNVPAAISSTIVACRVVRRLSNFTNAGPEMFNSSSHPGGQNRGRNSTRPAMRPGMVPSQHVGSGVHVEMETYTHTEPGAPRVGVHLPYDGTEVKLETSDSEFDIEDKAKAL